MKRPLKQTLLPILLPTFFLTGCDSLLYSGSRAPVYSTPQAKHRGSSSTSAVNSTMTPVTAGDNDPYAQTGSEMAVSNSQSNPYGNTSSTSIARGHVVPDAVIQRPENINTQMQQPVNSMENTVGLSRDSRIKTADEVLNHQQAVYDNQQTAAAEQTAQQTRTAVDSFKESTNSRANEVTSQVSSATENTSQRIDETVRQSSSAVRPQHQTEQPPKATASATTMLIQEATDAVNNQDYEKAASALERAHRIEPKNARILYDLAQIRAAQGKHTQAVSFASKAANYSNSKSLSKKIWTLLANSRRELGNDRGAALAEKKAASF